MPLPTDETIRLAQTGDRTALRALVDDIQPLIRRQLARYPVSEEDRQDLLQSTLMQVVRRLDSFRGESSFSTWLFRVTANEALMLMRTQRRHRGRLVDGLEGDELDAIAQKVNGLDEPFAVDLERTDHLRVAIDSLPETYKTVVTAHYGQELGLQEIARRFNTTEASVRSRLHRARARLRDALAEQRVDLAA